MILDSVTFVYLPEDVWDSVVYIKVFFNILFLERKLFVKQRFSEIPQFYFRNRKKVNDYMDTMLEIS
jgi:hypothetical protein